MKKKDILTVCLIVLMLLVSGCGAQDNQKPISGAGENTEKLSQEEHQDEIVVEEEEQLVWTSVSGRISYAGENYTWEEVSVTVPQIWNDKFIVKQEANGISFYQKASYEKEESLGFLCGIYRSKQYSDSGIGETLVAYSDEGMLYYVILPTDVTCYTEDEAIVEEYTEMMQYADWFAGNMEIRAENIHYDTSQYVIPVSSILPLEEYHVVNLTNNELWIARNEIYARHGKVFQNEYLTSYFAACSWYEAKEGKTEVSDRELNEVELANLKLIAAAEETYAKEHPYPKQYVVGEETEASLYNAKEKQRICYDVAENAELGYTCLLTVDSVTYDLNDYVMIINPNEDVYYLTDIAYYDNKLEIAILDNGPGNDPVTQFFQYDGELRYIGEVQGMPFEDYGNSYFDGFTGQNTVIGTNQLELIESAYVHAYYWYNSKENKLEAMERVSSNYTWYDAHELYVDIPIYYSPDTDAPLLTLQAGEMVYFIATDCREWILIRGGNGVEGYIQVKDGQILNIGLPAEEVFSDLYFFG